MFFFYILKNRNKRVQEIMEIKNIKELIAVLEQSNLSVLEVQEGETRIRIEKQKETVMRDYSHLAPTGMAIPAGEVKAVETGHEVVSPLVGNFYASSSPEEPPLVKLGDTVEQGQVLCIIEAMKVMNEITAPVAGTIKKISAKNGEVVEFGQVIFVIE